MGIYLNGDGSVYNPFVILTFAAFRQFITTDCGKGYYGAIAYDIDGEASEIAFNYYSVNPNFSLDLCGNKISNFSIVNTAGIALFDFCSMFLILNGEIDINVKNTYMENRSQGAKFENCRINLISSHPGSIGVFVNSFIYGGNGTARDGTTGSYKHGSNMNLTVNTSTFTDRFDPENYSSLKPELWVMDGASYPRIARRDIAGLVSAYAVKGVARIGNKRAQRRVRALSPIDHHEIASVISNEDGTYMLNVGYYTDNIFVSCGDDYGLPLAKNKEYVIGEIMHPTTVNGYRYVCDKAGNSGGALPSEPWSVEDLLTVGTARFKAVPVFQSMIAGPIKPRLIDLITGEPV
jgi:hypothetical protein